MSAVTRDEFSFHLKLAVRWGDMDAIGHVNNAKFFTYDESVRLDYFARLMQGDARFWKDYGLILAHIEADFIAQLKCPAELDIGFRIARLGSKSMNTLAGMFHGDRLIAVMRGVLVWFDYANNRTLEIPATVREQIRRQEKVAPE
jgi:acyl-CoA thioester hydrolase